VGEHRARRGRSPAVEYGTVPEWLAGAGTVGALVVALVLLSQDLRARREVEEERRRPRPAGWSAGWRRGMAFTDTSNRRWRRGDNGRLSQLVDDPT
jgi:hypothetical protein